jgi:hypothetical protein
MPFELGLDLGCRYYFDNPKFRLKKFLILEEEKYSTQKALSDMSFADCKCHNGEPEELVFELRNWFAENGITNLPSASRIWNDYNKFYGKLLFVKNKEGFSPKDINNLPLAEFIHLIDNIN